MEAPVEEAVILAGGLGTRLRSAVPDLPKCMAPVNGVPFLSYLIRYCKEQGIKKFVFALGYKSEEFHTFLENILLSSEYRVSIETEPLGTGGAVRLACGEIRGQNVIVVNGDTLFRISFPALSDFHRMHGAECTIALKPMKAFSRYGVVELDPNGVVNSFKEKRYYEDGLINGGVYALNVPAFLEKTFPEKFSFEKEYLEYYYTGGRIFGLTMDEYFIDIGIPEDYERASAELNRSFFPVRPE